MGLLGCLRVMFSPLFYWPSHGSEDKIILCFSPVRPHGYISQGQMGIDVPERRKPPPSAQAVAEETLQTPLLRRSGERMLESK